MALYRHILLMLLLLLLVASGGAAAAEEASWEGTLNYTAYNEQDCQTSITNGTTTKIFKMDDSKFCETDIIGNNTMYTKLVFSGCNNENEGSISSKYISCNDALCSSCEDIGPQSLQVNMTFNTARTLYNKVGSCFEYQAVDTDTDLDTLQSYWNVMYDNSCVFSDAELKSFITNGQSEVNWSERSVVNKEENDSTTNSTQEEVTEDWNENEKVSSTVTFGVDRVVISLALSFVYMVIYF